MGGYWPSMIFNFLVLGWYMDIFLIICGALCLLVGLIGCIIPIIPGAIVAWVGLLFVFFVDGAEFSLVALIIYGVVAVGVTLLDNFAPVWFTKRTGGTRAGTIGSMVGLVAGFFFGLWGIILCPFIGAFIGELIHDRKDAKKAFRSAWGSFLGFLCGTGIKIVACGVFIWAFIGALT